MNRYLAPRWLLIVVPAMLSVGYFVYRFRYPGFLDSTMGNLFATIVGVGVGIPIALEINRYQQASQDKAAQEERTRVANERKKRVLEMIRKELHLTKDDLLDRGNKIATGGQRHVRLYPLRDNLWVAFLNGGELRYINNPDLLASITEAYFAVRASNAIEKLIIDSSMLPQYSMAGQKSARDHFLDKLAEMDPDVLQTAHDAISKIDAELASM
jgi:hypothetical protein